VLQNKHYVKYANAHAVDVLAMEEMDRALEEKSPLVKTYKAKDAYGEQQTYLAEFAGLTVEELKELSTSSGALQYLHGTRIPFTAIVDPHTGDEMFAWTGVKSAKDYVRIIGEQERVLLEKYGEGVDRKLWNEIGRTEVRIDLLMAAGKLVDAYAAFGKLAEKSARCPEAARSRMEAMRKVLDEDARRKLEEYERRIANGEASEVRSELETLAKALSGTALEEPAAKALSRTK